MTEKSFQTQTCVFVFTFSCTTSSIVILSMFSRLFNRSVLKRKAMQSYDYFFELTKFSEVFFETFYQHFADALAPLLKSECKVTPFVLFHQIFLQLFFHYFLTFFTILLCINYLHYDLFYVVKHIFMTEFSVFYHFYWNFLRFFLCFICYNL